MCKMLSYKKLIGFIGSLVVLSCASSAKGMRRPVQLPSLDLHGALVGKTIPNNEVLKKEPICRCKSVAFTRKALRVPCNSQATSSNVTPLEITPFDSEKPFGLIAKPVIKSVIKNVAKKATENIFNKPNKSQEKFVPLAKIRRSQSTSCMQTRPKSRKLLFKGDDFVVKSEDNHEFLQLRQKSDEDLINLIINRFSTCLKDLRTYDAAKKAESHGDEGAKILHQKMHEIIGESIDFIDACSQAIKTPTKQKEAASWHDLLVQLIDSFGK